jgi:hypothetical protein
MSAEEECVRAFASGIGRAEQQAAEGPPVCLVDAPAAAAASAGASGVVVALCPARLGLQVSPLPPS